MSVYVQPAEIAPRAGNRVISTTTKPTTAEVQAWIDGAEAEILGLLAAVGIPTSYAPAAGGFLILREWVGNYIAGRVRVSWAAAAGDGSNPDGRVEVDAWKQLLIAIAENPDRYGAWLGVGSAPTGSMRLGSHTTDAVLGLEAADYAPVFTIKGENY